MKTQFVRHRILSLAVACVVVSSSFVVPGDAQTTQPATQPSTHPTTRTGGIIRSDGGFLLNFQDVNIDVILNELSDVAGLIVVKEVKPEGRVTLVSKQPVNADDAVSLLNTVLRNAGYAAIKQERILKIVNKDVAKRLNIPVRTGSDPTKIVATDELITQVIPLRFADATQLKTDLQPLVNAEADFASNASSNALVITDTSANVKRVVEIVAALDTSVADSIDVKVFQLKYSNATNAAKLINDVFGNIDASRTSGGQQGQNQGNQRGGQGGPQFGPGGFPGGGGGGGFQRFFQQMQQQGQNNQSRAAGKKVNAGSDERTNSLVVTGPPDTLEIVAKVVKELDANPAIDETVFVYHLRNSQSANVEGVLNSLFNGTSPPTRSTQSNADVLRNSRSSNTSGTNSRASRNTGSTFGGGNSSFGGNNRTFGGQNFQQTFGGGNTRVSQATQDLASSLAGQVSIIADTDSNSLIIRTSPSNYDRVKQVLEELDKPVAQVLIKVLIAEVTHDNGYDVGTELSVLNLRAGGNGQQGGTSFNIPTVGANATGLVVQILETNFQATIRALETAGKLDVLSRPYILASDNQLASITVGQEVPFITNSRITDTGQTINTIEYSDIGILLDVIPHINPDGLVILDVAPEISALTGTTVPVSESVSAPVIAKRSAQSRVGVKNGQTIVIGGLMEDRTTKTVNKVPILGDVPILGWMFKRTEDKKSKTELLIFLTPHVAARPEDLERMSNDETKGSRLLPNAVEPGVYQEHQEGMRRGDANAPATQPSHDESAP